MLEPYTYSLGIDYLLLGLIYNIQVTQEGLGVNNLFKQRLLIFFWLVLLCYFP